MNFHLRCRWHCHCSGRTAIQIILGSIFLVARVLFPLVIGHDVVCLGDSSRKLVVAHGVLGNHSMEH